MCKNNFNQHFVRNKYVQYITITLLNLTYTSQVCNVPNIFFQTVRVNQMKNYSILKQKI